MKQFFTVKRNLKIENSKSIPLRSMFRNIWFTSDLHLDHANIINICKRPFANVQAMNDTFINNFNSKVQDNDLVYMLGDIGMGRASRTLSFVKQLKGVKILVRGNHDHEDLFVYEKDVWYDVVALEEIRINKVSNREIEKLCELTLCHYPLSSWNKSHYGSINLHGHSHGFRSNTNQQLDVGVDPNGYFPLSIIEVLDKLRDLPATFFNGSTENI